jgi:hypothetical protein
VRQTHAPDNHFAEIAQNLVDFLCLPASVGNNNRNGADAFIHISSPPLRYEDNSTNQLCFASPARLAFH